MKRFRMLSLWIQKVKRLSRNPINKMATQIWTYVTSKVWRQKSWNTIWHRVVLPLDLSKMQWGKTSRNFPRLNSNVKGLKQTTSIIKFVAIRLSSKIIGVIRRKHRNTRKQKTLAMVKEEKHSKIGASVK
jgi:hypothetical protein